MEQSNRTRISTRRLTMNAAFIAIYVVLDMFSIYIGNYIKLSFAAFPLLVAAILFGPIDGVIVAGIGEFIYQMLMYGMGPTTVIWMIPPMVHALVAGLMAKKYGGSLSMRQAGVVVLVSGLIAAVLTTGSIYLDAKFWGYDSGLTAIVILFRFVNALIMCAIYTVVAPRTLQLLMRVVKPKAA